MARIYRRSDRIRVQIDDVTVQLAPLSVEQKTRAQVLMAQGRIEKDYKKLQDGIIAFIKYSLKDIEGLYDLDGNPYKLNFDENGDLSDECIDDLFNIEMHKKLTMVCSSLIGAIPDQFLDESGKPIEGVKILNKDSKDEEQNPN